MAHLRTDLLKYKATSRAEFPHGSDVDIFIIGRVSLLDVVKALAQAQERLGREMNPVVMTKKKFLDARKANERLVRRILDEPKLFLVGDVNALEELA